MTFYISLTHNCQFRCDYCYAGRKYQKSISKETILNAITLLFKTPMQKLNFGLFGGEPLMEWELLQFATYEMERESQKRAIELVKTVTTNGVLLSKERVAWLREHNFYVVVSIDGNEQMHNTHRLYATDRGTFQDVKKGILELQKLYAEGEYSVMSVVTPQNIQYLNASVSYLYEELGLNYLRLAHNYYGKWGDEVERYREIYHELGDYMIERYRQGETITIDIFDSKIRAKIESSCSGCHFGEMKIAIAPSGTIYPCERLIGNDTGELSMGNVYDGFDHKKRNRLIAKRGNSNEECKTCPVRDRCTNSCGCTNYTLTSQIDITNGVVCFFQKLFIEVADKVASTLYEERNELFMQKFYEV